MGNNMWKHTLSTATRRPRAVLTEGLALLGLISFGTAYAGDFPRLLPHPYFPAPVVPAPRDAGHHPTQWRPWSPELAMAESPQPAPAAPATPEELPPQKDKEKPAPPAAETKPKRKADNDAAPVPPELEKKKKPMETLPPPGMTPPLPGGPGTD